MDVLICKNRQGVDIYYDKQNNKKAHVRYQSKIFGNVKVVNGEKFFVAEVDDYVVVNKLDKMLEYFDLIELSNKETMKGCEA